VKQQTTLEVINCVLTRTSVCEKAGGGGLIFVSLL
jgi:hypothetical protein